jgi:hypothetical protein
LLAIISAGTGNCRAASDTRTIVGTCQQLDAASDRQLERADKPEQINKIEKVRGEPLNQNDVAGSGSGSFSAGDAGSGSVQVLVASVAREKTAAICPVGGEPSLDDVRKFMDSFIRGAGEYAEEWVKRMKEQGWKDHKGQPVKDWKKLAASWASGCEKRKRGVRR